MFLFNYSYNFWFNNSEKNQFLVINGESAVGKIEYMKLSAFYFNKKNNEENKENSNVSLEDNFSKQLNFLFILKINLILVLTYLLKKSRE